MYGIQTAQLDYNRDVADSLVSTYHKYYLRLLGFLIINMYHINVHLGLISIVLYVLLP